MIATVTSAVTPVTSVSPDNLADLPAPAARIRLKPRSNHRGMVDGAWWPRSRDLTRELPSLIAALEQEAGWGRIDHVTVNVRMWPDLLKHVRTGNHAVRMGWYDAEQDPHDICLLSIRQRGRWDLLIVPPELDPECALRLMAKASAPGTSQTASSLLATVSAHLAGPSDDRGDLCAWESEGGSRRFNADGDDGYEELPDPHARLEPVTV